MRKFWKKYHFRLIPASIVLLAFILRFYNYFNRFGIAYDQAHDAIIARYALEHNLIPLLGPFSSAGPFQTGGEWYWIIMLGVNIFPYALTSPWIFLTTLYVFFVLGMMLFGKKLISHQFGYLLGLLAAFSPAQIIQGVNLTNQTPQSLFSFLAILFSFLFYTTKIRWYLFFLAVSVGIASSIHLQGLGLLPLIVFTIIFSKAFQLKDIGVVILGLILPWLPVFIVDVQNNFQNTSRMISYYLHDQYNISLEVLGRRWKTYISTLWPTQWGFITGGNSLFGGVIFFSLFPFTLLQLMKRYRLHPFFLILIPSFLCSVIILRYTRTPLFESYFVFLHPYVLLLTAGIVFTVLQKSKIVGSLLLLVVIIGSSAAFLTHLQIPENYLAQKTEMRVQVLKERFPNEKFHVRSLNYNLRDVNAALSLYLYKENLLSENGRNISIVIATQSGQFEFPAVMGKVQEYQIIDLSSSSSSQLEKAQWISTSPGYFYRETQEWFRYHD